MIQSGALHGAHNLFPQVGELLFQFCYQQLRLLLVGSMPLIRHKCASALYRLRSALAGEDSPSRA